MKSLLGCRDDAGDADVKVKDMAPPTAIRSRQSSPDSIEVDPILFPGIVQVNAQGAFIVTEDSARLDTNAEDGVKHDTDIRLPNHRSVVSHVALDIGGSLIKLVYFSREPDGDEHGGSLHFLKFEADRIDQCLEYIQQLKTKQRALQDSTSHDLSVIATGGGAYKYYDDLKKVLGVEVVREDEMECLILGLDFFITEIPSEVFSYSDGDPMQYIQASADIYPYLLVNIGSGVSMIQVSGKREYQRVGGTSLGGGTFWGLLSLLTGANTFDEMLSMADRGDNAAVDMLVGDIYGTDYGKIGLKSTIIASSFGKVFTTKREGETHAEHFGMSDEDNTQVDNILKSKRPFGPEDISRSLLLAVSNNIGQIAYLQSEKQGLGKIYFGGSFIRGHRQTIKTLSHAINFWSGGTKQAYFLRHEGYLGSVGAFVKRQPKNWGRRNSLE